jgi:hypothetical protein
VRPSTSRLAAELSNTKRHFECIQASSAASVEFNGSGDSAENTPPSFERPYYAQSKSDVYVERAPWRLAQSQFRYRGEPNVIDLGEL